MRQRQRIAVILQLMEKMWNQGSWCGETHIQKNVFFLQELFGVPLDYEFVLYKYGPFSFDFSYLIPEMQSGGLVQLVPQSGYGPKIQVTRRGWEYHHLYDHYIDQFQKKTSFIAETLGNMGVGDLERIATGFFVTIGFNHSKDWVKGRGRKLSELKPHIDLSAAIDAINEVDQIIAKAEAINA